MKWNEALAWTVAFDDRAAGYLIDHSLYIYLIDQNGDVRFFFRPSHTAEEIATVARQLFR